MASHDGATNAERATVLAAKDLHEALNEASLVGSDTPGEDVKEVADQLLRAGFRLERGLAALEAERAGS